MKNLTLDEAKKMILDLQAQVKRLQKNQGLDKMLAEQQARVIATFKK